jgi:hypothetical protein
MSESQSVSRLELARDEVDRVFGNGHAAARLILPLTLRNLCCPRFLQENSSPRFVIVKMFFALCVFASCGVLVLANDTPLALAMTVP